MAILWPGILRAIGACRLRSRAVVSKTRPEGESAISHVEHREGALRKTARLVRPLILTIAAGLAFAALLRFHHAKFEDSMVRNFQRQQLDVARSWAEAVEAQIVGIRGVLASMASRPEVCRLAPGMKEVLSSCLAKEGAAAEGLEVLDADGATLWSNLPTEPRNGNNPGKAATTRLASHHGLSIHLPIELDGKQVGTLRASVNIAAVAIKCQPKANATYRSLCCMLSDTGEIIYGGDTIAGHRQVIHSLQNADAPEERVRNVDLLPYVAGRCIMAGGSGLAEAVCEESHVEELIAFAPVNLEGRRFGLVMGSPRADVSVPIASHERITYALIVALALLYFATGYAAHRSELAHTQLEEHRRRAAEEASKAKGNFLAKMSHELRTPMNGIISMTELARGADSAADRQRYLGVVTECADSLLSVVNDILDMSKVEAGKLELCHVPFNVPECVANTLASLAMLAKDKGSSLRWEIAPGVPSVVSGDPGRLRQVLNNLVGNAIKFAGGGEVLVRVAPQAISSDRAALRFEIRDTGPGMSADDLKRLFNPYYQCSGPDSQRKDSTGLGLAIAKQLVELMDGKISVASEAGKGTVFTFVAKFDLATGDVLDTEKTTLPSLRNVRALVISGVPANLRRFSGLIGGWAAKADCVADAECGLKTMKEAQDRGEPFGLILFDSSEPSMDAFAFAELASTLKGYEEVAVAAICPAGLRGDAVRCLRTGIDAYLGIPVEDSQFHIALRLAVQHAEHQKGRSVITKYSSPGAPRLRVLLVEDNPVNQQAASLLLGQWGHNVHTVGSGEEAISAMAGQEFDLVLMDLEMPGINGIEATAQIRQQEMDSGRRTPIIAMTAHALDTDRGRCLAAGMDDYISKPFWPDQLRRVVEAASRGVVVGETVSTPPPASAPKPPPQELAWDPSEALRLADGNRKAVGIIITTFLEDLRVTLPAAQSAALARNETLLAGMAHRWKGSLGLLGAKRALACAVRLEEACRLGETERLLEIFQQLHKALLELERTLSAANQESTPCESS